MKRIVIVGLLFSSIVVWGQTTTNISTPGNWDGTPTAATWSNTVGDLITENVTWSPNIGTVTFPHTGASSISYTIGNMNMSNGNTLTVVSSNTLTLGASGTPKSLTTDNLTTINVNGTLEIWGDLIIKNNLTWNITGSVIIHGKVDLGTNGNLAVTNTGTLTIAGDVTATNNTNFVIDGTVTIGGNLSVGNGSTISGTGIVSLTGTCADGTSAFCGVGPLPIQLIAFQAIQKDNKIVIYWSTSSEINFDYFDVEKSTNGENFSTLAKISGYGTSYERHDYSLIDANPFIGKNYYRLKSVDFDGYTETFKVVGVDYAAEKGFSIFPNPSEGNLINFQLNYVPEGEFIIAIYDNVGNVINRIYASNADQVLSYNGQLSSGVYFAKFITEGFVKVERFIVR